MDLKTRAMNMVTQPAAEWPVVATEPATVRDLMKGYAAPLAAIPAVCGFIGQTLVGISVPLVGTIRLSVAQGLSSAILAWVLGLVGAYVAALIIEKLAPKFQSTGDITQALKLVVFSYTPVWLVGVLNIIPALGWLGILAALYAIYVFYLGLPHVMRTPQNQVVPYMAVAALIAIVISLCLGAVTAGLVGAGAYRGF